MCQRFASRKDRPEEDAIEIEALGLDRRLIAEAMVAQVLALLG